MLNIIETKVNKQGVGKIEFEWKEILEWLINYKLIALIMSHDYLSVSQQSATNTRHQPLIKGS